MPSAKRNNIYYLIVFSSLLFYFIFFYVYIVLYSIFFLGCPPTPVKGSAGLNRPVSI